MPQGKRQCSAALLPKEGRRRLPFAPSLTGREEGEVLLLGRSTVARVGGYGMVGEEDNRRVHRQNRAVREPQHCTKATGRYKPEDQHAASIRPIARHDGIRDSQIGCEDGKGLLANLEVRNT